MSESKKPKSSGVLGLIIGAAVGSVIGASLAPEKGEKTRSKLKQGLSKLIKAITSE